MTQFSYLFLSIWFILCYYFWFTMSLIKYHLSFIFINLFTVLYLKIYTFNYWHFLFYATSVFLFTKSPIKRFWGHKNDLKSFLCVVLPHNIHLNPTTPNSSVFIIQAFNFCLCPKRWFHRPIKDSFNKLKYFYNYRILDLWF